MFERISLIFAICTTTVIAQSFNPPVTTGQYNTNRTSANPNEAILNTSNVNISQFGKLFSWSVDGWVFAQPLYVPGVSINGVSEDVVTLLPCTTASTPSMPIIRAQLPSGV